MANYIITKDKEFFKNIGEYNYCNLEDMILPEKLAIDTETTGLVAKKEKLFCIQIGTGKNNYIIDMQEYSIGKSNSYTPQDVFPYLENKILVFQNALFDLGFFYLQNFFPKNVLDTFLASKIIYNGQFGVRHDFGAIMSKELNIWYDKTDQKNINIVKLSQPSTIKYSFNDVDKLLELHDTLEKKIDEGGFRETYDLHCKFIRVAAYMEQCGFALSSKLWKAKMDEDLKNSLLYENKINEYIFDNIPKFRDGQLDMFNTDKKIKISISSPKQMIKVFKSFDIPVIDKDGKKSINENVISKAKHDFIPLWLKYQEAQHRVSTFGETIFKQIDNERIYTNFNPMVDTARLSTRKGGINFLNFPADKTTRNCFEANEGNVMIVSDFSAQEGVIMADLSGDKAMTASVVDGVDLHCLFAKVLFPELEGLSDEEIIKNHKDKRQGAKVQRFLFSYGGNAYTLHVQEGVPMDRAVQIDEGFKKLHEGLYKWGNDVFEEAIKVGYIESADGWKLALPKYDLFIDYKNKIESISKFDWGIYKEGKIEYNKKRDNPDYKIKNDISYTFYKERKGSVSNYFKLKSEYMRLCLNNPVQARGAHQLKRSSVIFFDWIERNNLYWKVLLDNMVHDEIIVECEEYLSEITTKKLSESMIEGGNYYLTNLIIQAEAHSGSSWGKAK